MGIMRRCCCKFAPLSCFKPAAGTQLPQASPKAPQRTSRNVWGRLRSLRDLQHWLEFGGRVSSMNPHGAEVSVGAAAAQRRQQASQ